MHVRVNLYWSAMVDRSAQVDALVYSCLFRLVEVLVRPH